MQVSSHRFFPSAPSALPSRVASAQKPSDSGRSDSVELGRGVSEWTPPVSLAKLAPAQETQNSGDQVLEKMRPYIKNVFVVSPAVEGAPPVLGGQGEENRVDLPQHLKEVPSNRWVITPKIEASHAQYLAERSNDELRSGNDELKNFVAPLLAERYGSQEGAVAVELGPATNTDIAKSFQGKDNLYFGLDVSRPFLERARELTNEPGYKLNDAYQVLGDTYQMPFQDDVADVVCVSCHPPFVSATAADKIRAFAEVKRVLKPSGEFALFPWDPEKAQPEVHEYINREFDVVNSHSQHAGRELVILRAK